MVWLQVLKQWKLALYGLAFLMGLYLGHYLTSQAWEAQESARLEAAINAHLVDQATSNRIGMDLETGLNDYRTATGGIYETDDSSGKFGVVSVQSITKRIAAGEAKRK